MTAALPVRWKKPKGGKAPAAYLRGSFSRTTTLRLRTTTAMRTTAPRSRRGARPARQESAHGFNPKRRRACLLRRRTQQRQAPVWPSRGEVATMRGRNTMRFSAPTREPPGGRPSRGAKLKGRGCTRQKDARYENRLGGTGAAKKAPSEQGATKAAGLGAADARLEPRQWSAAERVSRDRRRKRRCCARQKRTELAELSILFSSTLVIALRTPRQAQEAATQGTPISPSVFIGWAVWLVCKLFVRIGKSCIFVAIKD